MAVRTRAQLATDFADNTAGNISPALLRGLVDSIALRAEQPLARADAPPYSPTLFGGVNYDQEFSQQAALGGTELGSPATPTALVDGSLRVVSGNLTTADFKGREFLCPPSTPFKLTVRMRRQHDTLLYGCAQVMLRAGTSGAGTMAGMTVYKTVANYFDAKAASFVYTTLTNRSATRNLDTAFMLVPFDYVRILYDGTNVSYQTSFSGLDDDWVTFYGPEVAATVLGAAPGRFVLGLDKFQTTGAMKCYFDYARFSA